VDLAIQFEILKSLHRELCYRFRDSDLLARVSALLSVVCGKKAREVLSKAATD
jgi:hypothetical protein